MNTLNEIWIKIPSFYERKYFCEVAAILSFCLGPIYEGGPIACSRYILWCSYVHRHPSASKVHGIELTSNQSSEDGNDDDNISINSVLKYSTTVTMCFPKMVLYHETKSMT